MKKVMVCGLDPAVIDYSHFPGLTPEKVAAQLKAEEDGLRDLGFDVKFCLVDLGKTAEAVAKKALQEKPWDAVMIGAGVRLPPPYILLFEKLVNVVHEFAPQAKICFNTSPNDIRDAILRWVRPR